MNKICIGYGVYSGKCTDSAGTKWSPYWCERCNQLRLDNITKNLQRMSQSLNKGQHG